jgi:GntR family transcriptional regulator
MPFSHKPLYLQVRDVLADLISRGAWRPGFQVPNEVELAREVGVSSGTIRKALELLERQRLVVRRQGRGTFVRELSSDELTGRYMHLYGPDGQRLRGREVKPTEVRQCTANRVECGKLSLRAGADVYRVRRVLKQGGERCLLETLVLPVDLFPGLLDEEDVVFEIGALAMRYGILLGEAEERISLEVPSQDISAMASVPPGTAMIRLERIVMTLDERPVEWRVAYCHLLTGYYLAEIN